MTDQTHHAYWHLPPWGSITDEGDHLVLRTTVLGAMTISYAVLITVDLSDRSREGLLLLGWTFMLHRNILGAIEDAAPNGEISWFGEFHIPPTPTQLLRVGQEVVFDCTLAYAFILRQCLTMALPMFQKAVRNKQLMQELQDSGCIQDWRSIHQHVGELLPMLNEILGDRDMMASLHLLIEWDCTDGHEWDEQCAIADYNRDSNSGRCKHPGCDAQAEVVGVAPAA